MSKSTLKLRALSILMALLPLAVWAAGPDAFSYNTHDGAGTNVVVTSEPRTVSGFEGSLPVSVSAGAGAQYLVGKGKGKGKGKDN